MTPIHSRPQGVVFDLDGTLVDSRQDIAGAVGHALRARGFPELDPEVILTYVGDGVRRLLCRSAALAPDAPEVEPLLETFSAYYLEHVADQTRLMPGAQQALDALGHLKLAVCTNKPKEATIRLLDHLRLTDRFCAVVGGGDLERLKPDPLPILEIARRLGLLPGALVVVGDGPQDIQAARAAGARSVGVKGGIAPLEKLLGARADAMVDSLIDLEPLIDQWTTMAHDPR